jgi:hypothetical protein
MVLLLLLVAAVVLLVLLLAATAGHAELSHLRRQQKKSNRLEGRLD